MSRRKHRILRCRTRSASRLLLCIGKPKGRRQMRKIGALKMRMWAQGNTSCKLHNEPCLLPSFRKRILHTVSILRLSKIDQSQRCLNLDGISRVRYLVHIRATDDSHSQLCKSNNIASLGFAMYIRSVRRICVNLRSFSRVISVHCP